MTISFLRQGEVTAIREIGEILAGGLVRILAQKSSQISRVSPENPLDILCAESGHSRPQTRRSKRG
jgi:hypothetical protein